MSILSYLPKHGKILEYPAASQLQLIGRYRITKKIYSSRTTQPMAINQITAFDPVEVHHLAKYRSHLTEIPCDRMYRKID
ncbi:hypothetical protein QUB68_23110 [Microcoleus sp. A006_D1]|uniref:hypothetical protein n=1 Tax=Microcoleus sp. A006_D1 TaxID=3055267 RepID=UPI002FD203E6